MRGIDLTAQEAEGQRLSWQLIWPRLDHRHSSPSIRRLLYGMYETLSGVRLGLSIRQERDELDVVKQYIKEAFRDGRLVALEEGSAQKRSKKEDVKPEPVTSASPIPGWEPSQDSVLVLIDESQDALIIPGSGLAYVPSKTALTKAGQSPAHYTQDLGTLLEVPAVGSGGTRVFRAGPRGALMIDAGSDPRGRVSASVYVTQLQAVMANLGISRVDQLQIIHVHKDHISSIPEVVETYRLSPDKLSIPAQFLRLETMQKVINELRRRPTTRALGYTESWSPGKARKDRSGGRGDIFVIVTRWGS